MRNFEREKEREGVLRFSIEREGGREGVCRVLIEREREREGVCRVLRETKREGGRDREREGEREGGREREREGGKEGGTEGRMECVGVREGGRGYSEESLALDQRHHVLDPPASCRDIRFRAHIEQVTSTWISWRDIRLRGLWQDTR